MIAQAEFLRLQHPCGYCGTRIRDVFPLELSPVCDWFPTQAPALQSLFSSPSAVVQQSDFIKYLLCQLMFSLLHKKQFSFCSTDEDIHPTYGLGLVHCCTLFL